MPLSIKEKRGLIIGLIAASIVLVLVVITVVFIAVFERKKVDVVKAKLPVASGVSPVKEAFTLNGKNASALEKPKQSNKTTNLEATIVSSPIVDSWNGANLSIVGNTDLSYPGSFGKMIPLKNRGTHSSNEYFEQSSLGPMYLIARKKLLSVQINFLGTFYITSYKIDNEVEINPQLTAIKISQGEVKNASITTTQLHDSLKIPLTSPPLARKVHIDSTFFITMPSNPNVPVTFEKDDVLAILFAPEGNITYTPYVGSVSIVSAVAE